MDHQLEIPSHSEIARILSAYHDGELDEHLRSRVERHLHGCRDCAGQLDALSRLSSLLTQWPAATQDVKQAREFRRRLQSSLPRRPMPTEKTPPVSLRQLLWPLGAMFFLVLSQSSGVVSILIALLQLNRSRFDAGAEGLLSVSLPAQTMTDLIGFPSLSPLVSIVSFFLEYLFHPIIQSVLWVLGWILPLAFYLSIVVILIISLTGWAGQRVSRRQQHLS